MSRRGIKQDGVFISSLDYSRYVEYLWMVFMASIFVEQSKGQHVLNKTDYLQRLSACVHMCCAGASDGDGDVRGAARTCALSLIHGQTSTNTQVL